MKILKRQNSMFRRLLRGAQMQTICSNFFLKSASYVTNNNLTLFTKPYRFVKLTVNGNELDAKNLSTNVVFPIMDSTVTIVSNNRKETSSIKLHEINHSTAKFFDPVTEEYSVVIFFSNSKAATKLPAEMSLNIINFLKLYKPMSNSNYCCINFAYEMAYGRGKIAKDNDTSNFDELSNSTFSEAKLAPGSIVHLFDTSKTNHHYAISIGQNYYLSLFGTKGPLIVTTLDAVKKGFSADTCVQAIKKVEAPKKFKNSANNLIRYGFYATAAVASAYVIEGITTKFKSRM